jgi:hypothetical protein
MKYEIKNMKYEIKNMKERILLRPGDFMPKGEEFFKVTTFARTF